MSRFEKVASGAVLVAALAGCGSTTPSTETPPSSTTVAPATRSHTIDASTLVLRADDYPTGRVDEQGRADMYDEPPPDLRAVLDAARLPFGSAFVRSFHIPGDAYGSITSFVVAAPTDALAASLFRDGSRGLLKFNGFAGGTDAGTPITVPAGLGTEAVAFSAPGLNGGTTCAVAWLRNRAIGLLIVDRAEGDPRPELDRLSHVMDARMQAAA